MISLWQTATARMTTLDSSGQTSRAVFVSVSARITLCLLSAGLMTCALPEPNLGWLAWIALVPLFIACDGVGSLPAAGVGFLYATAVNVGIYHWLLSLSELRTYHFLIFSTFLAVYPAIWCAGIPLLKRLRLPSIAAAAALWITLDYVRSNAGFLAFPWGTLAYTQHQNLPVLQVATITGAYGLTFLIVMANAAIAGVIIERSWRGAIVAGLLLTLFHVGGAIVLFGDRDGPVVRLAAAQPSILVGEQTTATGRATTLDRVAQLTRDAAASRPMLVAWPESAVVGNFRNNPFLTADIKELARQANVALVMGVTEVEKFTSVDAQGKRARHVSNAAYVVTAEGLLEAPYIKRVLLPFAEYVPFRSVIGWPAWLVPNMIDFVPGDKPHLFKLHDGTLFAPLICWESLFAGLARESVGMGARVLVQLNNNTWFGRSAAAPQQNISSVLRAVENRVPVVLSSNSGPSQIIDPYGRIVARTAEIFTADFAVGNVRLGSGHGTLYTQIGDLFAFITIAALVFGVLRRLLTFT